VALAHRIGFRRYPRRTLPARVGALTEAFIDITTRDLEAEMNRAWHRAFWLGYVDPGGV
jgi:hypothetical protein